MNNEQTTNPISDKTDIKYMILLRDKPIITPKTYTKSHVKFIYIF